MTTLIALALLLQDSEFKCADGYALKYALTAPDKPEEGKKYPLVLCLHGRGGNSTAAKVLARDEMKKKHPCFILAPSVNRDYSWSGGNAKAALPYVFELVDDLMKKHPVDPDRVYVTGQSMGGYGTFGALAARPEFFAAAAPVCGGGKPADASKHKSVPIWVFHGADDPTVPVERSREMVKALKDAGAEPKYEEYPGVKHNSWDKAYATAELWSWMFEQVRKK
jgi:predicted peptidase